MNRALLSLIPILLGIGFVSVGNGLLTTIVGLRLGLDASPRWLSGVILAAHYAGFIIGVLTCGPLLRRVGHVRAFAAAAALIGSAALGYLMTTSPLIWSLFRLLGGLSIAVLFAVTESWLNERAPSEGRGVILGVYVMTIQAAMGLGQGLLLVLDVRSIEALLVPAICLILSLVPVTLTSQIQPEISTLRRVGLSTLFRRAPLGLSGCLTSGVLTGALITLGPLLGQDLALDERGVALLMGSLIIGGLLGPLPLGALSDRVDRRLVLVFIGLGVAGLSLLMALSRPAGLTPLCALAFALGSLVFAVYPVALAHANDRMARSEISGAAGTMLLAFALGALAGPVAGGLAMSALGPGGLFALVALVALALVGEAAVLVVIRAPWRGAKRPFLPVSIPQAAPRALALEATFSSPDELETEPFGSPPCADRA